MIAAVILAGGESRRMGFPKLTLNFEGKPLLAHAVEKAQAVCAPVVVVVGAYPERYGPIAEEHGVTVIFSPGWSEGLAASLRAGVEALPRTVKAALVLLADQPLVSAEHLQALVSDYRETGKPLVFSRYDSVLGAPTLIDRSLFLAVSTLKGNVGARALATETNSSAVELEHAFDVDTPEDAARLGVERPRDMLTAKARPVTPSESVDTRALLDTLPLGVALLRPVYSGGQASDFEWRMANRLATPLPALSSAAPGSRLLDLVPDLTDSDLVRALRSTLETGEAQQLEQMFPSPEGEERWYTVKVQPLKADLLVTFEDISRHKLVEEHVKKMAFQDELTGIYNRRYFQVRTPALLALARREAWTCALLYFDLNGFKAVNDTYGHAAGDKVLQAVAWRLSRVSRDGDIFFRSSGDEFALFLPSANEKAALRAAERVSEAFTEPFSVDGVEHPIGASVGVAVMLSEDASVDALLERADKAMYAAKADRSDGRVVIRLWSPE